jgi:hypothetical protein
MSSKKPLILALVIVNAALLGLLVVLHADRTAQAQVVPNAVGRFVVVSQRIEINRTVLWVLDTQTRRLIGYEADKQTGLVRDIERFDLGRVFGYREEAPQPPERGMKPS